MSAAIKNVVCAISGGVDSCVAALLLKKKGFHVQGVFMKNWDIADETGNCQADKEMEDAAFVCRKLGITFCEANFVKEYWNNVFSNLLQDYKNGLTPNPDIICNKKIKFDVFFKFAINKLKADAVATGHYARVLETPEKSVHLLRGIDHNKDQTFFLSQISQEALRKSIFPLGNLTKDHVKRIAHEAGFGKIACKKESTGICFVGRRKFQSFIEDFLEPKPGCFINIENGYVVGQHKGIHCWTIGQRCLIGGHPKAYYVAEKNVDTQEILIAPGNNHLSLYHQSVITEPPHWITCSPPRLSEEHSFICDFRFQHREPLMKCMLYKDENGRLHVLLKQPLRALTYGQFAVFYKGEECLGSARIISRSPSIYDLTKISPYFSSALSFPQFYKKINR